MAGSYLHLVNRDGSFDESISTIENLGDAQEALEECYYMIQWLAKEDDKKIYRAWLYGYLARACPSNVDSCTYDEWVANREDEERGE